MHRSALGDAHKWIYAIQENQHLCAFSQAHQALPQWDIKEPYSCRCDVVVSRIGCDAHVDGAGLRLLNCPDSVILNMAMF